MCVRLPSGRHKDTRQLPAGRPECEPLHLSRGAGAALRRRSSALQLANDSPISPLDPPAGQGDKSAGPDSGARKKGPRAGRQLATADSGQSGAPPAQPAARAGPCLMRPRRPMKRSGGRRAADRGQSRARPSPAQGGLAAPSESRSMGAEGGRARKATRPAACCAFNQFYCLFTRKSSS